MGGGGETFLLPFPGFASTGCSEVVSSFTGLRIGMWSVVFDLPKSTFRVTLNGRIGADDNVPVWNGVLVDADELALADIPIEVIGLGMLGREGVDEERADPGRSMFAANFSFFCIAIVSFRVSLLFVDGPA